MEREFDLGNRLKHKEHGEDVRPQEANNLKEIIKRLHANTISSITPPPRLRLLRKDEKNLETPDIIDDNDLIQLAQAFQNNISLQSLSLKISTPCNVGLKLLAKSLIGNATLTELRLEILENQFIPTAKYSDGLLEIIEVLNNTAIKHLWLTCSFDDLCAHALGNKLKINQKLVHLRLITNKWIDLRALGEALSFNTTLRNLHLSVPGFTNEESLEVGLKHNNSLRFFSADGLTRDDFLIIAHALEENSGLQYVDLKGEIDNGAIQALAKALVINKAIRCFFITAPISDQGACDLADVLKVNKTLHTLELDCLQQNPFPTSDLGAQAFAEALKFNSKLKRLVLQSHKITEIGLIALLESLAHNKSLGNLSFYKEHIMSVLTNGLLENPKEVPHWKFDFYVMRVIDQLFKTNFTLVNLSLDNKKFEKVDAYLQRNRNFMDQLRKEFRIAVEKGDLKQIIALINRGIDIDDPVYSDPDENNRVRHFPSALHYAVSIGQLPVVEFLLRNGANPFEEDENYYTVLDYARWNDQQAIVDFLTPLFQDEPERDNQQILLAQEELQELTDIDVPVALLQQQILEDFGLFNAVNNNVPAEKVQELTDKELFDKALEESKKTYEQLLQTSLEEFTQSMAQNKLLLEHRLLEEDKQKIVLQEQIQKLETELQKHAQDERATADAIQQKLQIQRNQLRKLKIKQHILWKEHQIKEKQKRVLEQFKNSPNLLLYYRTIQICIQQLFISSFAGAGGKPSLEPGEALDMTQQGLEFFGDLCNIAPIVGPAVNFILKWGVGKVLEKIDGVRQENDVKNIASLLSLTELKEISENVAEKLTIWYEPVLKNLATLEDEAQLREDKKKQGRMAKLKQGMKELKEELQEAVLKKKYKASACKAAEFAITWALDELEEFDPDRPLDDQFIRVIITKKASYSDNSFSLIKKTRQIVDNVATNISKALGKKTVIAKVEGKYVKWHLWEMYSGCGIKTETEIYGNKDATVYGYCNGIGNPMAIGVAKARGLPSQGENRKYSKEENSKKFPTSPAYHRQIKDLGVETKDLKTELKKTQKTAQVNIEGVKKKSSELEIKVAELEQKLKEQDLQHQKEIEKIKAGIGEEVQKQFQTHFSQVASKSTGTPFWNGSALAGSAPSQPQQTSKTPNTSTSAPGSKR